jgi:hypothetical protein
MERHFGQHDLGRGATWIERGICLENVQGHSPRIHQPPREDHQFLGKEK